MKTLLRLIRNGAEVWNCWYYCETRLIPILSFIYSILKYAHHYDKKFILVGIYVMI